MKNKLCVSKTLIITLKGPIMTPNKYDESSSGWMSRQSHNYQYTHTAHNLQWDVTQSLGTPHTLYRKLKGGNGRLL